MKYHKLFFLIFSLLILNTLYLILYTNIAYANDITLSVSPSLLQINAIQPSDTKSPITLENPGDNSANIQVLFKPFHASRKENGEIEYVNNNEIPDSYKKILSQIHITDNGIITSNFELGPKQKKNLELQFTIPKNEAGSDYYFSVIFLASRSGNEVGPSQQSSTPKNEAILSPNGTSPQDQNFSTINAGIAINVLLSIGDKNHPQGAIEEFSAPAFLKSGPVDFTVRIKNTGSHVIRPIGIIFIKNMFGQTVGRIDLEPDNILSGSIRTLTDTQTASNSALARQSLGDGGSTPKTIWPEHFLLGPYTATLNIAISDKGPIYNRSIIFLALPLHLILGIILGVLITITIFLRVKYHLKNDK
jgi:hypothetical protein